MTSEIEKQREIQNVLQALAVGINETLKSFFGEIGFALLTFEFHAPGVSNYISNAQREDMIKALRETADRLEKKQDIPPVVARVQ